MKQYLFGAALASIAAVATPASASTVVDGSCVSVTASAGCLFDGNINSNSDGSNVNSYVSAQNAYNTYNDDIDHLSANPDILLQLLASTDDGDFSDYGTFTGANTPSGSWDLPGFLVDFVAVKASDQFVLYKLAAPASSGTWDTSDIPFKNNPHDVSHLVFFGTEGTPAVPEPATWAMMIGGFGLVGGAIRRRRTRTTVTYA